jgi:hypothetical protein
MPTNPNVTPSMKPQTANPIIPDLREHLSQKLKEIVKMDANEAKAYDTSFTWAVVKELN